MLAEASKAEAGLEAELIGVAIFFDADMAKGWRSPLMWRLFTVTYQESQMN